MLKPASGSASVAGHDVAREPDSVRRQLGIIFQGHRYTISLGNRIDNLPPALELQSHISPMRYAVDLVRGVFYAGRDDATVAVLDTPAFNLGLMGLLFLVFLFVGTARFVRRETDR